MCDKNSIFFSGGLTALLALLLVLIVLGCVCSCYRRKRRSANIKERLETTHNLIKGCITEEIVDSLYSLTKFDFYYRACTSNP